MNKLKYCYYRLIRKFKLYSPSRQHDFYKELGNFYGNGPETCINCGGEKTVGYYGITQTHVARVCRKCLIDQDTGKYYKNQYGNILEFKREQDV